MVIRGNGEIQFSGETIASIDNFPFAKLNSKRKLIALRINNEEKNIEQLELDYKESSDNSDIEEALSEAKINLKKLKIEKKKYDEILFSRAIFFIHESNREMSELVIKARELFWQGRMSDANKVLNLDEMIEKDNNDAKLFEEARQTRIKSIHAFQTKAEIVILDDELLPDDRFKEACIAFENAIRISKEIQYDDKELAKIYYDFACLYYRFGEYDSAETTMEQAMRIYLKLNCMVEPKLCLINLANIYAGQKNYHAAINTYEGLLRFWLQYDGIPQASVMNIIILKQLGSSCLEIDDFGKAEVYYKCALKIIDRLNSDVFQDDYPEILSRIAAIHLNQSKLKDSERELKESYRIYLKLSKSDSDQKKYQKNIAELLACLGGVYSKNGEFDKAEEEFKSALEIYKQLNPSTLTEYSRTLNMFASMHNAIGKLDAAERESFEALYNFYELSRVDIEGYEKDIALSHYILASIYEKQNKYENAVKEYLQSLSILQSISNQNPSEFDKKISEIKLRIALIQTSLKNGDIVYQDGSPFNIKGNKIIMTRIFIYKIFKPLFIILGSIIGIIVTLCVLIFELVKNLSVYIYNRFFKSN